LWSELRELGVLPNFAGSICANAASLWNSTTTPLRDSRQAKGDWRRRSTDATKASRDTDLGTGGCAETGIPLAGDTRLPPVLRS